MFAGQKKETTEGLPKRAWSASSFFIRQQKVVQNSTFTSCSTLEEKRKRKKDKLKAPGEAPLSIQLNSRQTHHTIPLTKLTNLDNEKPVRE